MMRALGTDPHRRGDCSGMKRARRPSLTLLFTILCTGSLAPLLSACDVFVSCNDIGFAPSFMLTIAGEGEEASLDPGSYELMIEADGVSWSFDCGALSEVEAGFFENCEGTVLAGDGGDQQISASMSDSSIELTAQRRDEPDVWGIDTLEVAVVRDGVEIASEVYTPEYTEALRGSRACGVTEQAPQATLSVPGDAQG